MIQKIYSVYDSKSQSFTPPFFQHQEGMAIRTFGDCINNTEHTFGKHPEDYTLYDLGIYDDSTGTITQNKISSVATGLQLQESKT